jgi:hypothetical protein
MPKVFYKVNFPDSCYRDKESDLFVLDIIGKSLAINQGYEIKLNKNGVMNIVVPEKVNRDGTIPEEIISSLMEIGMDVKEIRYEKDLSADQLFYLESRARRFGKTIIPIETLSKGLKIQWRDAPYGYR